MDRNVSKYMLLFCFIGIIVIYLRYSTYKKPIEYQNERFKITDTIFIEQTYIKFRDRIKIYGIVNNKPISIFFIKGKYEIELIKKGKIR